MCPLFASGDTVFCGLRRRSLPGLDRPGETLEGRIGVSDIIESRSRRQTLCKARRRTHGTRPKENRSVSRSHFWMRFLRPGSAVPERSWRPCAMSGLRHSQRWRSRPQADAHVLRLAYRSADGHYYGVEREYQRGTSRTLVRLIGDTGKREQVCRLNSWDEEFGPTGDAVVNSNGEVIEVATGNTIKRLAFPRRSTQTHDSFAPPQRHFYRPLFVRTLRPESPLLSTPLHCP